MARGWLRWANAVPAAVVAVVAVAALVGSGLAPVPTAAASSPVAVPVLDQDFPDPSVMYFNGTYYAYATQTYVAVPGATSTDALHWDLSQSNILPTLPSWASAGETWAPSVAQNAAGQFVMFYTAHDTAWGLECIGRAVADSPQGPFVDSSTTPFLCDTPDGGAIDPSVFVDPDGNAYLMYKNDGNSIGAPCRLWSVPLDNDFNLAGDGTILLSADQWWQQGIVEGPDMVYAGGQYDLFYAGGQFETAGYGIGYAVCSSPAGPCTDSPANPVLASAPGMSGPGGPSLFSTPSGQLMMAFAAWPGAVGYQNGGHRAMYMADVTIGDRGPAITLVGGLPGQGYWEVGADGGVFAFGDAGFYGSTGNIHLNQQVAGMAATADGKGYWLVAQDGGIFAYGDAGFYGSTGSMHLNQPVVGMAATADGKGYWLVARDGGIFAFGDARFHGSMGGRPLASPIVGMAADPGTGGYWLVARDGGVFAFDATYYGSTGALHLAEPIVGLAPMPNGTGYWLASADGGVFAYGQAHFLGSITRGGGDPVIVAIVPPTTGYGYRLIDADGNITSFGNAPLFGSMVGAHMSSFVIAGAST